MDNKLRNKLNNVLKGLILSKEQKKELVEVFEEISTSTSGNNGNDLIIYLDTNNGTIKINDFVYNYTNGDYGPHLISSTDLFNYINNNNIKHATLILDAGALILTCNSTAYVEGLIDDISGKGFQFYNGQSISIIIQNKN